MKLLNSTARLLAIVATVGLVAAPIASADQGRRGNGAHDGDRGNHRVQRDNRRNHARNNNRRNDVRRDQRRYSNNHRPAPRYNQRRHAPKYVYRAPPRRAYAPRYGGSSVIYGYSTGPGYYNRGYAPRYSIGHRYGYNPHTVYVRDYHRYGLYAPPRGYHWVHDYDRGDAILASVATGAIIGLVVGAIAYD